MAGYYKSLAPGTKLTRELKTAKLEKAQSSGFQNFDKELVKRFEMALNCECIIGKDGGG